MKIIFPENIFTSIVALLLPEVYRSKLQFQPASSISASLDNQQDSIGLIPVTDLLNHRELFISQKYGISFEGSLCNSYIYFSDNRSAKLLNIAGDVSSSEVILSKILFKELYNVEVEIGLTSSLNKETSNLIIAGTQNFYEERLFKGVSFSEEFIELLSLPYVNYVLASPDQKLIRELEPVLLKEIAGVYDMFDKLEQYFSFSEKILKYIHQNISSLVLELDEQDIEAMNQVLLLPYYHGLIKDIIDVKFAGRDSE
jgi:hypothetical protein